MSDSSKRARRKDYNEGKKSDFVDTRSNLTRRNLLTMNTAEFEFVGTKRLHLGGQALLIMTVNRWTRLVIP